MPLHLDIVDDKIWGQRDETEDSVTCELVEADIPKDQKEKATASLNTDAIMQLIRHIGD